jgi:hypothetical protein
VEFHTERLLIPDLIAATTRVATAKGNKVEIRTEGTHMAVNREVTNREGTGKEAIRRMNHLEETHMEVNSRATVNRRRTRTHSRTTVPKLRVVHRHTVGLSYPLATLVAHG